MAVTLAFTASFVEPPPVDVAVTSQFFRTPSATPFPTLTLNVMSNALPPAPGR